MSVEADVLVAPKPRQDRLVQLVTTASDVAAAVAALLGYLLIVGFACLWFTPAPASMDDDL
jgi:hypothetical protein